MNTTQRLIQIILLCVCLMPVAANATLDATFEEKLTTVRWVAYSPTNCNPDLGTYPDASSLESDLRLLRDAGFNGIITYGSSGMLALIPETAKRLGFVGVLMGVWDIFDQDELQAAVNAAPFVDGYCLGNEGLHKRYEREDIINAMDSIRQATRKPVTTTEEVEDYANATVAELGDWVFPNIHPIFFNAKEPKKAVAFIAHQYKIITRAAKGRPVLVKEAGFPTKGDIYANQRNQEIFFTGLEQTNVFFAYFEAFDQPWKKGYAFEPHWGLFENNRRPKRFIKNRMEGCSR